MGSDVAAITTTARPDGDDYVINGQKMWLTNGGTSSLVAVLVRTPLGHDKPHQNLTTFLLEKTPGFGEVAPGLTIPGKIEKMGYKGSTPPSCSSTVSGSAPADPAVSPGAVSIR